MPGALATCACLAAVAQAAISFSHHQHRLCPGPCMQPLPSSPDSRPLHLAGEQTPTKPSTLCQPANPHHHPPVCLQTGICRLVCIERHVAARAPYRCGAQGGGALERQQHVAGVPCVAASGSCQCGGLLLVCLSPPVHWSTSQWLAVVGMLAIRGKRTKTHAKGEVRQALGR